MSQRTKTATTKKAAKVDADINPVLAPFSADVRAIALELRKVIQGCAPQATEVPQLGYKAISYTHGGMKRAVCAIGLHATRVNLQFYRGTSLEDPNGLLEGTGKTMRHIKLSTTKACRATAVAALIKAADALSRATV